MFVYYAYGSIVLADVEFRLALADNYTVTLGAENMFDELPGNEKGPVSQSLGVWAVAHVIVKRTQMKKQWFLVLAVMLLLITACSGPNHADEGSDTTQTLQTLTGEVFYREQHYLPPGAHLNMILETASEAGSPSQVIATSKTLLAGSQPYRFTLEYSPADIDARTQYNLRATITFYGDLLFTSATRLDPFRHPEDSIAVRVTRVGPPEP